MDEGFFDSFAVLMTKEDKLEVVNHVGRDTVNGYAEEE